MDRLRQIAQELEELDKLAEGNEIYQKASRLYYETAMIQARDTQESNKKVHKFIQQHENLQSAHYQAVELNDMMCNFIVSNGLLSELQEYIADSATTKVLH
ncbi:hypothetical protein M7775_07925 [Sporomusa sphaeroides DSM 2875]|uniref:hypothetical protein n=1 Tax=Sporomusa sphaeroides TaxID=47679 RepID=UPI002030F7A1|nr:hypothetical protein [Sporomusa sphaeroides]MCM0758497.1 hypothetical protein [Sporomusa sphaeroides DSM 2875]